MAEKESDPSPLNSWRGKKLNKKLKSFRFDPARVYSHKNETVLIHAGNMNILDEIVDYELGRKEVLDRGVLLVRLSDEVRPVLSDESVISFLLNSGDHEKCKHLMRPTEYIYENVYCKDGKSFPTGVLCQPILIQSAITANSVTQIDKDLKKDEKKDKKTDGKNEKDSNDNKGESVVSTTVKLPCLGYDSDISKELHGVLRNGTFVLKNHNDKKRKEECPCSALDGKKCTITSLESSPDGNYPLLHWAYLGHCRLLELPKLQGVLADRLNNYELQQFEKLLGKLLKGDYCYEYMIYEGLMDVEVPFSSQRYDMASWKNPIDECMVGDARGGITFPWTYVGFAGSIFPTHVEDIAYLNSINLMIYGSPKLWIIVGPSYAEKLQKMVFDILNNWTLFSMRNFLICTLLHKMTFVHPALLEIWEIPYTLVVQKPGDLLYTCAGAFHWGCNLGVNINVAKNSIQYDFKMRLLKEMYDPVKDKYMCGSNCPQSFCRDLDEGVIGRFLLSFYKLLFKGQRESENEKELLSFFTLFYSSGGGEGSTSAQKMAFVGNELSKKREQIVHSRNLSEKSLLKKIQRLQCSEIREVSGSFTFSFFHFASDAVEPNIFPSHGLKLTQKQENLVLDGIPYMHIVVQHSEYGSTKEMNVSSFEKMRPGDKIAQDSNDENAAGSEEEVQRTFQSYSLLIKYWTNVEEGKDYKKVKNTSSEKDHDGFLLDLDVLVKRLAKAKKEAVLKAKQDRNLSCSNNAEDSENSTDDESEKESDDDEGEDGVQGTADFYLLEKQELKGTAGFRIVESSGRLKVVEVQGKKYFVCTTCFDFKEEIIDYSKKLVKQKKDRSEIEISLKNKLEGKNGVAVLAFNMKEHIKKWCERLGCMHKDCKQTFTTKHSLALHIRGQHQSHLIFCPLCNIPVDNPNQLRDHWCNPETACVRIRFFEKKRSLDVVGFQCSHCSKAMTKVEQWDLHLEESSECKEKITGE